MHEQVAASQGAGVVMAYSALSLLRCFRGLGLPVAVVDTDPNSLTLCSKYAARKYLAACPRVDPERAVAGLIGVAREFAERPMLAFDNEPMLLLASRHRETLGKYYRFLLPAADLVEDLSCKLRFAALAQRLGLPVPRGITPGKGTSVEEIAEAVGFPCVLKPDSHTGRFKDAVEKEHRFAFKVLQANSMEELKRGYEKMPLYCDSFLVQQYIPGDDRSLYSFHTYLDADSHPLGCFIGRKIRTYPKGSGGSSYLELVHEPELVELGLELMRRMQAVGPMKIDFKKDDRTGKWYILECNARFTLWNYLGAANGMNLPMRALAEMNGEPIRGAGYQTKVRWLAQGSDFKAFVRQYRPEGDWNWRQYLWSLRGRKVHEVFAWGDSRPALTRAWRYLALRARRVWVKRQSAAVTMALRPAAAGGAIGEG